MRLKSVLLGSAALLALGTLQSATAEAGNMYFSVLGGADWSNADVKVAGSFTTVPFTGHATASTGFVLGGALGYDLSGAVTPGLRIEAEVAKRQDYEHGQGHTGAYAQHGDLDFQSETWSVMANIWYDVDTGTRWSPYLGGGAGWAQSKVGGHMVGATATTLAITGHGENSGFAWQLGVGLDCAIKPGVTVGLGYRYFHAPDVGPFEHFINGGNFIDVGTVNEVHGDAELHIRFSLN